MGLQSSMMSYIRFFVLLTPVILPTMAIFGSLYESNLKGFIYILGLTFTMLIGKLLATSIGNYIPGDFQSEKGERKRNNDDEDKLNVGHFRPIADAACTLIGDGEWGTLYGMPAPHALMIAFTATYMMFPMFLNYNVSLLTIGGLLFLLIVSAVIRVVPPMTCVYPSQVLVGWATGFILGTIYYFTVVWLAGSDGYTPAGITYFERTKSDRQQCTLGKKAFRCKKERKA